ncbi:MAG: RluA family pseudouridine synthase [Chlamydiota bacterium]
MKEVEELDHFLLVASKEDSPLRIDRFLAEKFPEKSRSYFQYLIAEGCVLLNGKPVKKRVLTKEEDEIEVFFQITPEISLDPEDIPLDILYEDEWILAAHKPPGMVVHPAPGNWSGTFVNALLHHCKTLEAVGEPLRPGIVHRLDKDTSGVLVAAKTPEAHRKLIQDFAERRVKKQYLALCQGKPKNGPIETEIARHPKKRKEMCISTSGKTAISNVLVLAFNEKISFVLVEPLTGRTHQIRLHLRHLNAPILGDHVYGFPAGQLRQLLHAYRISFLHPITGSPVNIVAPIPLDMRSLLQKEFFQNTKNLAESFS